MRRLAPAVYAIVFLDALLQFALVPLLPEYQEELAMSKTQAGIIIGAYSALVLAAALPIGHFADRVGAKRLTVGGAVLLAVSTALFGVADSYWTLLAARSGQGIASAISWTAALAWLAGSAESSRRARLLAGAMAAGASGALLGPVLSGPMSEWLGIRGPFVVFAVVAAAIAVWLSLQAEVRAEVEERLSPGRLLELARGSGLLAGAVLVTTLVAVVSGALETLVPLKLGDEGWSAVAISATLGAAGVLGVLTNIAGGRLYGRVGGVRIGTVAMIGAAVTCVLLTPPALSPLAIAAIYVVGTPAISAQYSICFPMAADGAEEVGLPSGVVLGAINVCWGLGFTVGPAAGAAIAEASTDGVTYAICAALSLLAVPALRSLALPSGECQEPA